MVIFNIAGCKHTFSLVHVAYLANHLSLMLPDFQYKVTAIEPKCWPDWLANLNNEKNWVHIEPIVVWKHIPYGHGKDVYIGGITEFWEYIYEYYKIDSYLIESQLKKLVKDYAQFDVY